MEELPPLRFTFSVYTVDEEAAGLLGDIYSIDGVELTTEESSIFFEDYDLKILQIKTLIGEIYETPSEGQIYIKDNILTFYTITNG